LSARALMQSRNAAAVNAVLPPLLRPHLSLVICGSAAGARSAAVGHYYAGPGNKFWKTLSAVGLTDRVLAPAEYRKLLEWDIGLTDLVRRQSGSDAAIDFRRAEIERLRREILKYQPRYLCFNGKRAAQEFFRTNAIEYGIQKERIGATRIFVAPSTSGAASGAWDIAHWRALARRARRSG
jgi:TDG/mug DNA glycosylase family protein